MGEALQSFLDVIAFLGVLAGGIVLFFTFGVDMSAPQLGASSAFAVALCVLPYSVASLHARAIERKLLRKLIERG